MFLLTCLYTFIIHLKHAALWLSNSGCLSLSEDLSLPPSRLYLPPQCSNSHVSLFFFIIIFFPVLRLPGSKQTEQDLKSITQGKLAHVPTSCDGQVHFDFSIL